RSVTISGNGRGTAPKSTAMSTCSDTQILHHQLMRSKRSRVLFVLGVIAIVALCFFILPLRDEPKYQGRYLSDWLKRYAKSAENSAEEAEAVRAVQAIGTNCLPEALAWIQYEPGWRDWLCNNLPSEITENHYVDVWLARPKVNAEYATFAFWILGTNAASTIPKLESMLHDPREETVIQA